MNEKDLATQKTDEGYDDVTRTIKEIELERKDNGKKKIKPWLMVLMIVFFPVTLCVIGLKKLFRKLNMPITAKMTVAITLVFALLVTLVLLFTVLSVKKELGGVSYVKTLTITAVIVAVIAIALFAALTAIISQLMMRPVGKMIDQIDRITGENLSARLSTTDSQDELQALTERINAMLENLEQSFDRQQNFVADASHELKTPIAVIQGYANLLSRWGKEKPDILQEGIEAITRESANMKKLIDQLLMLARLGNLSLNKTKFNAVEVVKEVVESYKLISPEHALIFYGDSEVTLETDKSMLTECVRTLVDNAIKYTPAQGRIRVSCRKYETHVEISVSDTGIGIAENELKQIFERFYRCDKARVREKGGSGLGLSIASSIVSSMGGTIGVTSMVGKGSTFTIKL